MDKALKSKSKFLSLVLRHQPELIRLPLDANGWADIEVLLAGAARQGVNISFQDVLEIVATNDKQRFALSEDKRRIRASQGHSIDVDLQLTPVAPPEVLFHGSATRFADAILAAGLQPGQRRHVHLSADVETAHKVGSRHGKPVIFRIDAKALAQAGHAFYLSANQVWLTDAVPPQYLSPLTPSQQG
ncbi:RNA 2'-phosphotransferase [Hahella sp. KA22]|uniref:RNA 2'-phosphotransferase n=1 Tax=Hahella sp. KA22 TaxID=1628392 RepID=UPI000FDE9318|nr:RNA 2'-phosphotransferase [Hahella sp. KA22]AZZ89759.1 RNA 2'-phosphotransferase [Hahella sp. KA22]QAY53129.1 RNA 2'-phosphotransferase [Hahella sp. KA22]